MGKTVYAHHIMKDNEIPGAILYTSTLLEELDRIEHLLSDKTGTLILSVAFNSNAGFSAMSASVFPG